MVVAIHAFENTYGGLHGIEHYLIVEVDNIQQAEEWASEESREVMESYSSIMEDFADSAENDGLDRTPKSIANTSRNVFRKILAIRFGK